MLTPEQNKVNNQERINEQLEALRNHPRIGPLLQTNEKQEATILAQHGIVKRNTLRPKQISFKSQKHFQEVEQPELEKDVDGNWVRKENK